MEFKPFENESQTLTITNLVTPNFISDLQIENRVDRVSIFGNLDITKDKKGLAVAKDLKSLLDSVVVELSSTNLPECIKEMAPKTVKNPFK